MIVDLELTLTRLGGPPQDAELVRQRIIAMVHNIIDVEDSTYQVKVHKITRRGYVDLGGAAITVGGSHPETSQRTARAARNSRVKQRVLEALYESPDTDDGLERCLGLSHQSVSAARRGCVKSGLVVWTGRTAPTRYGNQANVWRLTADARETIQRAMAA